MIRIPFHSRTERPSLRVSAVVQRRRILLRGPVGFMRKTRPLLTDT
jgi:hypothetical protein